MNKREEAGLLRAVVALAVADGAISRSERGVLANLAQRVGISRRTLTTMVGRARRDPAARDELFRRAASDPALTLEMLVAVAQIDGSIHVEERRLLEIMMEKLDVPFSQFDEIYQRGVERADALRRRRPPAQKPNEETAADRAAVDKP